MQSPHLRLAGESIIGLPSVICTQPERVGTGNGISWPPHICVGDTSGLEGDDGESRGPHICVGPISGLEASALGGTATGDFGDSGILTGEVAGESEFGCGALGAAPDCTQYRRMPPRVCRKTSLGVRFSSLGQRVKKRAIPPPVSRRAALRVSIDCCFSSQVAPALNGAFSSGDIRRHSAAAMFHIAEQVNVSSPCRRLLERVSRKSIQAERPRGFFLPIDLSTPWPCLGPSFASQSCADLRC